MALLVLSAVSRALLLAALVAPAAHAASGPRLSLAAMAQAAGCVVHGTVTDVRVNRDEKGLPATWVTLDVHRTIKAPPATRMTFKQTGTSAPLPDGMMMMTGLPTYAVGDEVVLFLYHPSSAGYTSPLAMGQGYFRVERSSGRATVRSEDGPSDLDQFLATIERLAKTPP